MNKSKKSPNSPNSLNIKVNTNRFNHFAFRKKVPQRMANKDWKYLQKLSKNLIARIINFSEIVQTQSLLALEFFLLTLNF